MAALEQKLERALAEMKDANKGNKRGSPYVGDPGALGTSFGELVATALQNEMSSNWEFQKVLESEKAAPEGCAGSPRPSRVVWLRDSDLERLMNSSELLSYFMTFSD